MRYGAFQDLERVQSCDSVSEVERTGSYTLCSSLTKRAAVEMRADGPFKIVSVHLISESL